MLHLLEKKLSQFLPNNWVLVCVCSLPPSSDARLGRNGAREVKRHLFFKQDSWTWDNIRQNVPPVVPELKSEVDTQYFDVIEDEKEKPDSFAVPRVRVPAWLNTTLVELCPL